MKQTLSEAQLTANRENARLSTGPVTAEGKKKVTLNPLKHGFSGHTVVIPEHEVQAFRNHLDNFKKEYQPKGITEEVMVQSLADLSWSTQQIRAQLNNLMAILGSRPNSIPNASHPEIDFALSQAQHLAENMRTINLLGIYEQRKMRLFNATRRELAEIQAARKQAEAEELAQAARIRKADPDWRPVENGFVCSLEEIDRYISRQNRLERPPQTHLVAA